MKTSFWLLASLLVLLLVGKVSGQGPGALYSNVILQVDSTTGATKPVANVPIYVCREPASGTSVQCTSLTTIYSNIGLTNPLSNPTSTDANGNVNFYVSPGLHRIQVLLNGVFSTQTNVPLTNPFAPIGSFRTVAFSATPVFDASLGGIYSMTLTGNVTSSSVSNATAGQIIGFKLCEDATGSRSFIWPTNFLSAPSMNTQANACNYSTFFYDGTSWNPFSSGGGGSVSNGAIIVSSSGGMQSWVVGNTALESGFSTPVSGRMVIGDGSGWRLYFSKRSSNVDTDLLYIQDDGSITSTSTNNGTFDVVSSNAGTTGGFNKVRYTGCANTACVSENGNAMQNLVKMGANTVFASLGTPANGNSAWCTDCVVAKPCAGSGAGALAIRVNGVWNCY